MPPRTRSRLRAGGRARRRPDRPGLELAEEICECAPLAVREIKRAAQVYLEEGEQAAYREIPAMRARTANSADFAEGIASFVERRKAKFQGR